MQQQYLVALLHDGRAPWTYATDEELAPGFLHGAFCSFAIVDWPLFALPVVDQVPLCTWDAAMCPWLRTCGILLLSALVAV